MPSREDHAIAAVVVLYRPDASVVENVSSYADQVSRVFAVDNSEQPEPGFGERLSAVGNVTYLVNGTNLGIAAALNVGVRTAAAAGYTRVLTMDQDSTATPGMVDVLAACMDADGSIGLVSPVHRQVGGSPRDVDPGCHDVLTAMTSGNLVRILAYETVGGFMDELFIDQVDNEFCLRLHRAGLRVVEAGDATLIHRVGEVRKHRFPYPAYSANHSALRRYYIARNRFAVGEMYRADYPEFRSFELAQLRKDVVKIVLYERQKCLKLRMIRRGVRDYRRGVTGPYPGR